MYPYSIQCCHTVACSNTSETVFSCKINYIYDFSTFSPDLIVSVLISDIITSMGQYWQRMAAVVLVCTSAAIAWQWLGMLTLG